MYCFVHCLLSGVIMFPLFVPRFCSWDLYTMHSHGSRSRRATCIVVCRCYLVGRWRGLRRQPLRHCKRVNVRLCVHVCVCVCVDVCVDVCVCVNVFVCFEGVSRGEHTRAKNRVRLVCVCVFVSVCICAHAHMHTQNSLSHTLSLLHVHTHAHTH